LLFNQFFFKVAEKQENLKFDSCKQEINRSTELIKKDDDSNVVIIYDNVYAMFRFCVIAADTACKHRLQFFYYNSTIHTTPLNKKKNQKKKKKKI